MASRAQDLFSCSAFIQANEQFTSSSVTGILGIADDKELEKDDDVEEDELDEELEEDEEVENEDVLEVELFEVVGSIKILRLVELFGATIFEVVETAGVFERVVVVELFGVIGGLVVVVASLESIDGLVDVVAPLEGIDFEKGSSFAIGSPAALALKVGSSDSSSRSVSAACLCL
jgi:hypothetical protein